MAGGDLLQVNHAQSELFSQGLKELFFADETLFDKQGADPLSFAVFWVASAISTCSGVTSPAETRISPIRALRGISPLLMLSSRVFSIVPASNWQFPL